VVSAQTISYTPFAAGQLGTSQFVHNGIEYSFETGNLAQLSDGSSLVKFGNTWVLAAVTSSDGFRVQERIKPNITVRQSVQHLPQAVSVLFGMQCTCHISDHSLTSVS